MEDNKTPFDDFKPEEFIEREYAAVKRYAKYGLLKAENVKALAELTTELANRLKVEEACGKQEKHK